MLILASLVHVVHFIRVCELPSSLRGEDAFQCTLVHVPLLMELDPTDKSLLPVYVITVEKFVKLRDLAAWFHKHPRIGERRLGKAEHFITSCALSLDVCRICSNTSTP